MYKSFSRPQWRLGTEATSASERAAVLGDRSWWTFWRGYQHWSTIKALKISWAVLKHWQTCKLLTNTRQHMTAPNAHVACGPQDRGPGVLPRSAKLSDYGGLLAWGTRLRDQVGEWIADWFVCNWGGSCPDWENACQIDDEIDEQESKTGIYRMIE